MKKLPILCALITTMLLFTSSKVEVEEGCGDNMSRKSAGPPSCYAGEPPLFTSCGSSGCHDDSPINSGLTQVNLSLGGADSHYIPGQQYTVTVSLNRTGIERGGFQIVALQDNDISKSPGIITLPDPSRTQRIDAAHPHSGGCATQDKVWISHTSGGIDSVLNNTIEWKYNWLAPSSDVGNITFYLAAIDANKDLDNTGDQVYTLSKTISAVPLSVKDIAGNRIKIFPNPADQYLHIEASKPLVVSIINANGKLIKEELINSTKTIDVSGLQQGVYYLRDENNVLIDRFTKID